MTDKCCCDQARPRSEQITFYTAEKTVGSKCHRISADISIFQSKVFVEKFFLVYLNTIKLHSKSLKQTYSQIENKGGDVLL